MKDREYKIPENTSEPLEEALPVYMHQPVLNIMGDFLQYDINVSVSPYTQGSRFTIFGKDLAKDIYDQAKYVANRFVLAAAPLDQLEKEVRNNPNVLLPVIDITPLDWGNEVPLRGTLVQLAIICQDQTIRSWASEYEGAADRLLALQKKLLPETMPQALAQVQIASLSETPQNKLTRQSQQSAVLMAAFDLILHRMSGADKLIQDYIISIRPKVIVNNQYYLHLIDFLADAFGILASTGKNSEYIWYVKQSNQFCSEVIQPIQKAFTSRQLQILMSGTFHVIRDKEPERLMIGMHNFTGFYDDYGLTNSAELSSGEKVTRYRVENRPMNFRELLRLMTLTPETHAEEKSALKKTMDAIEKEIWDELEEKRRNRFSFS